MKTLRALALAATLASSPAAAQQQVIPGLVLPPTTVIGNTSPFSGNAVAVPFSSLQASLNVPAAQTCPTNQWFRALGVGGVWTCSQPAVTNISGFGTGIAAALALPVGSGGAPVLFNGAAGTPSSISLINGTGLPVLTGISGLGTGVAGALGVNVGSPGAFYVVGGALGTPSSATLTNATGLPISTGVSGLGANVASALQNTLNASSGLVSFNGILGTVQAGSILTNATGLPISTGLTGAGAGCITWLATPSSANLLGCLTDETGTGAAVFASSPALAGTPTAPTAAVDTNTTQVATTAMVLGQAAAATPLAPAATAVVGTSTRYARADHVHPSSPYLQAYLAANQSVTDNTATTVNIDTIVTDSHSWFNTGTHLYTPQRAGSYLVTVKVRCQVATAITACVANVRKNITDFARASIVPGTTTQTDAMVTAIVSMNGSSDTISANATVIGTGGSDVFVGGTGPELTYLSIVYVAP